MSAKKLLVVIGISLGFILAGLMTAQGQDERGRRQGKAGLKKAPKHHSRVVQKAHQNRKVGSSRAQKKAQGDREKKPIRARVEDARSRILQAQKARKAATFRRMVQSRPQAAAKGRVRRLSTLKDKYPNVAKILKERLSDKKKPVDSESKKGKPDKKQRRTKGEEAKKEKKGKTSRAEKVKDVAKKLKELKEKMAKLKKAKEKPTEKKKPEEKKKPAEKKKATEKKKP